MTATRPFTQPTPSFSVERSFADAELQSALLYVQNDLPRRLQEPEYRHALAASGYIDPRVAMPVMLGVLAGALVGAKLLVHMRVKTLRMVFGAVILTLAIEMIVNGITGKV